MDKRFAAGQARPSVFQRWWFIDAGLTFQANSAIDGGLISLNGKIVKLADLSSSRDEGMNGGRGGALAAENSAVTRLTAPLMEAWRGQIATSRTRVARGTLLPCLSFNYCGGSCSSYKICFWGGVLLLETEERPHQTSGL